MASNDTKLGIGLATGMFYHAPSGTALPAYPLETLAAAWKKVGDVSVDGITLSKELSTENLKNWANQIVRVLTTDHRETISAPIQTTTAETLKTVLGSVNVTETAATSEHGALVTASLSAGSLPEEEAFLFLMKDGDDAIAIGCTRGQVSSMDSVSFAPGAAITWTPTITALGDGWVIITDDGQTA